MKNVILKMNYMGRYINLKIYDTNRCVILDIINDMYDEADANGMPLPENPSLSFRFKSKSIDLVDDKNLLDMFSRVGERKEIEIWIEQASVQNTALLMTRRVRADNVVSEGVGGNGVVDNDVGGNGVVDNGVSGNGDIFNRVVGNGVVANSVGTPNVVATKF
ncbi:hypothetical protein vseg_018456 [Gypsophila vaccaria]